MKTETEAIDALIDALDIEADTSAQLAAQAALATQQGLQEAAEAARADAAAQEPVGGDKYLIESGRLSDLQEASAIFSMLDDQQGAIALDDVRGRLSDVGVLDGTIELLVNGLGGQIALIDREGWVALYCHFQQRNHQLLQEASTSAKAQCSRAKSNRRYTPAAAAAKARAAEVAACMRVGCAPPLKSCALSAAELALVGAAAAARKQVSDRWQAERQEFEGEIERLRALLANRSEKPSGVEGDDASAELEALQAEHAEAIYSQMESELREVKRQLATALAECEALDSQLRFYTAQPKDKQPS